MEDEALAEVDGGARRRSGDLLGEDVEVKIRVGVGHAGKLSFAASGALVDADLRSDGRAAVGGAVTVERAKTSLRSRECSFCVDRTSTSRALRCAQVPRGASGQRNPRA